MMYDFDKLVSRENTNSVKWDIVPKDIIPMWVADMDFTSPPEVIAALQERVSHGIFGYCGSHGGWLEALTQWMDRRHNYSPKLEWISTSPGVVAGLIMLVRALTESGDKIIIQPPVYRPFYNIARSNGCELVENPLYFDGLKYRLDFEQLKKVADSKTKLLILCSPHNPVGRVWEREELAALGEFCLENNITIISDEIHADLVLPTYQHTVLTAISKEIEENMIVVNAPSKTFNIPGIPASNIIIPNEKLRRNYLKVLKANSLYIPDVFAVTAATAAYTYGDNWLDELLLYLDANINLVANTIKERIPEIKLIKPEGTYLLWLDFRSLGYSDKELDTFIKENARLWLEPGINFGRGGNGFMRMNIASPRSRIQTAIEQLVTAIRTKA